MTVEKLINQTAGENCAEEGDYLSWKEAQWNVTGNVNQESIVKEEDLCYRSRSNMVLFTDIFPDWEECMLVCEKLPNSRSPSVASDTELLDVMGAVSRITIDPETGDKHPGVISVFHWIAVSDSKIEGQWVDFYTSDPVDISGVAAGEPDGGRLQNCAILVPYWGGWQDWECEGVNAPLQCPCESKNQMILTLRGLCPKTNIDKHFVPQNKEDDGQTLFRGLNKTIIQYQQSDHLWHLNLLDSTLKQLPLQMHLSILSFLV